MMHASSQRAESFDRRTSKDDVEAEEPAREGNRTRYTLRRGRSEADYLPDIVDAVAVSERQHHRCAGWRRPHDTMRDVSDFYGVTDNYSLLINGMRRRAIAAQTLKKREPGFQ